MTQPLEEFAMDIGGLETPSIIVRTFGIWVHNFPLRVHIQEFLLEVENIVR
jgi:hypothetical protein